MHANTVKIYTGFTTFMVEVDTTQNNRLTNNTLYALKNFSHKLYDLSFDRKQQRYVRDKSYFIEEQRENSAIFLFPINYYNKFMEDFSSYEIPFIVKQLSPIPDKIVDIKMNPGWVDKNEVQSSCIDFLTVNEASVRCLALQTGKGKSYCATKSAVSIRRPFLIIASGLVEQWVSAVKEQTNLTDDDIYLIKGSKSIFTIMENDLKPKCVIASLETIRNFAQRKKEYKDFDYSLQEVLEHLSIGVKIVDECHENFYAIVSIDLVCNVAVNIYLSATYGRTNKTTNKIFHRVFPEELKFGEQFRTNYVDVKMFSYASFVPSKLYTIGGTYSHFRYEKLLFKNERSYDWFFGYLIRKIMEERYLKIKKPGQKLLIIMGTINVITKSVDKLTKMYPYLVVRSFVAKDPEANLDADIIISTIGSAGTGRDIKNLVSVINTVSFAAENQVIQLFGRLREIPGSQVYFNDIYNLESDSHIRHKKERANIYLQRAAYFADVEP